MARYETIGIELDEDGYMELRFLRGVYKDEPIYDVHIFNKSQVKNLHNFLNDFFSEENVKKRKEQKAERERAKKEFDERHANYVNGKLNIDGKGYEELIKPIFGDIFGDSKLFN